MKELNKVFQMLRGMGYVARQRYKCCSSCAGAAIAHEFNEKAKKDPSFSPKGFIFYHQQDTITEREIRASKWKAEPPSMQIRFGPVEYSAQTFQGAPIEGETDKKWGLPIAEIGKRVTEVLQECGIVYEWDGNPDKCIEVFPYGKTKRAGEWLRV